MPTLSFMLETALYVQDLNRSARFYRDLFDVETLLEDERMRALSVCGKQVLLLFKQGGSRDGAHVPGGYIPPHDASGQSHLAFAIPASELDAWRERLAEKGVEIESTVHPPRGGTSIYFRDPDGHLVELATPGIWPIY